MSATADPILGQRLGDYRIERRLGEGGMGVVYLAEHVLIGQRVALKVMKSWLISSESERQRFTREAQVCCAVEHEGLVRIYGFGQPELGLPYIVMEYLPGRLLRQYLDEAPACRLPALRVVELGRQIADALCAVHAHGIVHRDLKPSNVMLLGEVAGSERVKLLDFGIAKFVEPLEGRSLTTSSLFGTPTYMSPEQIRGSHSLSERSDVYALGIMLYEMLCGAPPFIGDSAWVIHLHVFENPRPVRELCPETPPALAEIVEQMLAKTAAERPSMSEVRRALGAPSILSPRPSPRTRARRLRNLGIAVASVFVTAVLTMWNWKFLLQVYYLVLRQMAFVPGATFTLGSTEADLAQARQIATRTQCTDCEDERYRRELPAHDVTVDDFYLDQYEVTNEQFAAWLNRHIAHVTATTHTVANDPGGVEVELNHELVLGTNSDRTYCGLYFSSLTGKIEVQPGADRMPVTMVTWLGAKRYCEAQHKRLPTEAEWELAARGTERRLYPWGNEDADPERVAVGRHRNEPQYPLGRARVGVSIVGTSSRDHTPSWWGRIYDLGGNVAEWVADPFLLGPARGYLDCPAPCRNPSTTAARSASENYVLRGGGWMKELESPRAAGRGKAAMNSLLGDTGFRCAR